MKNTRVMTGVCALKIRRVGPETLHIFTKEVTL
jgi:hypothetical protein